VERGTATALNIWTAGPNQFFFGSSENARRIERTISDTEAVQRARRSAVLWANETFCWPAHLAAYEALLTELL
jgi:hypothetical protein